MDIAIRRMTPSDVPQAAALWNECFAGPFVKRLDESEFRRKMFEERDLLLDACLVAGKGERLVGIAGCVRLSKIEHDGYWYLKTPANLNMICVRPDCRRQGVGRRLVAEVERIAQATGRTEVIAGGCEGLPRFTPGIASGNDAARAFFDALGYKYVRQTVFMETPLHGYAIPDGVQERARQLAAQGYAVAQGTVRDAEAYHKYWIESEWAESAESRMARFKENPGSVFFVRQGGKVVGQIDRVEVLPDGNTAFGVLSFLKEYRRLGLGSWLMASVLKWFSEHGGRRSLIWTYEQAAAGFYPKVGYQVVERWLVYCKPLPFDYASPEWINRWGH